MLFECEELNHNKSKLISESFTELNVTGLYSAVIPLGFLFSHFKSRPSHILFSICMQKQKIPELGGCGLN